MKATCLIVIELAGLAGGCFAINSAEQLFLGSWSCRMFQVGLALLGLASFWLMLLNLRRAK